MEVLIAIVLTSTDPLGYYYIAPNNAYPTYTQTDNVHIHTAMFTYAQT